jgi:hypothetical protein
MPSFFIIPYRDRLHHLKELLVKFREHHKFEYEMVVSHQYDKRPFNRGAIKNLGFIYLKRKYPTEYRQFSLVFHDVDIYPTIDYSIEHYTTVPGVVKHLYGVDVALGGIIVINAGDFEDINGFPNYWGWGMEDNALQNRAIRKGLIIDRSNMEGFTTTKYKQIYHDDYREIDPLVSFRLTQDDGTDGITSITDIYYNVVHREYDEVFFSKWTVPITNIPLQNVYKPARIPIKKFDIKSILYSR